MSSYDPLYLEGIACFNRGEYFAAHEVWEDLWSGSSQPARRFYQGLIQAAVALHHATHANPRGAWKLYHRCCRVMATYRPGYLGLDLERFLDELCGSLHTLTCPDLSAAAGPVRVPRIHPSPRKDWRPSSTTRPILGKGLLPPVGHGPS
jgi:predicted metal-dependent hydrolase